MPEPITSTARLARFGVFELDLRSGDLRKSGTRINLQEQSLQVLSLLLERAGELVAREELQRRLWADGTFVDADHGLNAVINRLRDTLGDSADSPRFIETLPRRGYRFIAPVELDARDAIAAYDALSSVTAERQRPAEQPLSGLATVDTDGTGRARPGRIVPRTTRAIPAVVIPSLLAIAVLGAWLLRQPPGQVEPHPRVVPLTRLAGKEGWPAFAPDGEQVAFAWSGEEHGNHDIYVTLVGTTAVRRVTTDPSDEYAPSWSPDGARIAFLRRDGDVARVHVVSALGGPATKVSHFPVGTILEPAPTGAQIAWSANGRYIAAARDPRELGSAERGIHLLSLDGGEPRAITRPTPPAFDLSPAISHDGRRLAYVTCATPGLYLPSLAPQECGMRVVDIDETVAPTGPPGTVATGRLELPAGLAWSRDGRSILVGGGFNSMHLWRVWVDGSGPAERVEIAGANAEAPATARTRDRVVFAQHDWDAQIHRFNKGLPPEHIAASSSFETDPSFSPDGHRLAFASERSGRVEIWVGAADGSEARQVTHGRWVWPGSPSWSPDGGAIAFDGNEPGRSIRIWTIDADGGTPRQLTYEPGDQTVPSWSHDGRWIYYSNHHQAVRNIWRVPSRGGRPEQVTRAGSGFLGYETADGKALLYQPKYGDAPLLLLPLTAGGVPQPLVNCVRSAGFATAGSTVVYVACGEGSRPALHVLDMTSGRDRLVGRLEHFPPDTSHVNLAVSRDGTILFRTLMRRGGDLMLIENFR